MRGGSGIRNQPQYWAGLAHSSVEGERLRGREAAYAPLAWSGIVPGRRKQSKRIGRAGNGKVVCGGVSARSDLISQHAPSAYAFRIRLRCARPADPIRPTLLVIENYARLRVHDVTAPDEVDLVKSHQQVGDGSGGDGSQVEGRPAPAQVHSPSK